MSRLTPQVARTFRGLLSLSLAAAISLPGIGLAGAAFGPDVASWQHPGGAPINWLAVRSAGNEFAIVKATEGLGYVNPHYVRDSIGITTAGMLRGTYHYADVREPAIPQALKYGAMTLGQRLPMDLPPVIDFEKSWGRSPEQLSAWLREFVVTITAIAGRKPILYTYPSFWRSQMRNTTEFSDLPLWIADYNGGVGPSLPLPGGWRNWDFWQFSDATTVPGMGAPSDLNLYGGVRGPMANYTGSTS